MSKWRIGFFEAENGREPIRRRLSEPGELFFRTETLNERSRNLPDLDIVSVFIKSRLSEDVFNSFPNLKMVATRSTGHDHIDLRAAEARGIMVCNVPTYGENTVAEHTFALILALSRNIHKANVRTMQSDFSLEGLRGFDLKDKTLGVIGAGHIGLHVIKMAKGFGLNVLAFDVTTDPFLAEVLGFQYADFGDLLANSDIITLHAPYSAKTHHLIDRQALESVKPGALLINTARGALVDTEALVWALDQGIIGGAGLDVLEGEELVSEEAEILSSAYSVEALASVVRNHILARRDNVVITPHIAFYSREALQRIVNTTIDNIVSFIGGRPLNAVTKAPPFKKAA